MATALVENLYNSLPSLEEADTRKNGTKGIEDIISGPIRDVFIKYGLEKTFCLYLQHRHHRLDADERVVKVEGTAHVMNGESMKNIESFGSKIIPTVWMTHGSDVLPMEWAVASSEQETARFDPNFTRDLTAVLHSWGCQDLFGIDTLLGGPWSEMSIGTASVVVPSNNDKGNHDNFIPVALAFDKEKSGFRVHGRCGKDHKHTTKPT